MKILQISNYFYPHIGGVEQVARDIVGAIEGCEQKVFCFNHEKGDASGIVDSTEIIRAGCFAKIASQSLSLSYGKLLKKTFKSFQPDIVIFHYPNPFGAHSLLKILKKYRNCKLVLYWHLDITKQKILGKLFKGQTNRLIKRAAKIVATSPNYIDGSKFLSINRDKCTVIPNCVNESRMNVSEECVKKASEIRDLNAGKTICFAIGRHVPYKGMEYLVRASKLLGENYRIYIGGAGPLTKSLKDLAKDDEKVCFLGKVDDISLNAYMLACDIFCFPSVTKNEAFGIALAEAMSFGKPAVTFIIEGSGVNYVSLNGITGIEVENGNVNEYSKAIEVLAKDENLRKRYGQAAKLRVAENFTYDKFKINVNKLLEEF